MYLAHVCQLVQVISLYCSLVTHNLLYFLHHPMNWSSLIITQCVSLTCAVHQDVAVATLY